MANKEDLRRRNRELRHRMVIRAQEIAKKNAEQLEIRQNQVEEETLKKATKYPDLVLTLLKRLRRISPWNTVVEMNPYQCALVSYYKLRQIGMKELKIGANGLHAWVEFNYDNRWWTFDPIAIRKTNLGEPIKNKLLAKETEYTMLTRYYNTIKDYLTYYETEIDVTEDEAKILAMEDPGLNTITSINYH